MAQDDIVLLAKEYYKNRALKQQQTMMDRGQWVTKPPLGYKTIQIGSRRTGHKDIIIDEETVPIIRFMFQQYATGTHSLKSIQQLVEKAFNRKITTGVIHDMLNNKFYIGIMTLKGKEYPHRYEPIIDPILFNTIQSLRPQSRTYCVVTKNNFIYRGLILCGECPCSITADKKKQRFIYYHCTGHENKHKKAYVREEIITQRIIDYLKSLSEKHLILFNESPPENKRIIIRYCFGQLYLKGNQLEISKRNDDFKSLALFLLNPSLCISNQKKSRVLLHQSLPMQPITGSMTPIEKTLIFCRVSRSVDEVAQLLKIDVASAQVIIMDLQIEGTLSDDGRGKYISI